MKKRRRTDIVNMEEKPIRREEVNIKEKKSRRTYIVNIEQKHIRAEEANIKE
jgi:hypothetical protein